MTFLRATARRVPAAVILAAVLVVGCGKKGPPVAPRVRIPAEVEKIAAARVGDEVYVTFTVPAENIDGSVPLDIARIDVYGYTGRLPPPRARWAELGEVVASVAVTVPLAEEGAAPPPPASTAADGTAAAAVLPGTAVTVRDVLTPEEMVQGRLPPADVRRPELAPVLDAAALDTLPLRRFYMAIPFSTRDRNGPPGGQAELLLAPLPDPPTELRVSYSASQVSLTWEPSGGLMGFLLDRALPLERPPFIAAPQPAAPVRPTPSPAEASAAPSGPTTYNVYRDMAPDPLALSRAAEPPPGTAAVPAPINTDPITGTSATDLVAFDRPRCYVVRARRGGVLSQPSPPACLRPVDIFPPSPPAGLAAVASEGAITLIWEPGSEPDLGGYLVLRREAGDATLRQLTEWPVTEARYRDTTVRSGVRYTYSVVAVDSRLPLPNVSAESERVEETAP